MFFWKKKSAKAAPLKREVSEQPAVLPRHVAFIMDGNGRWAKKRGMPREYGHRFGVKAFRWAFSPASNMPL